MSGKWAAIGLIGALVAFGYLFTMNPDPVSFQIIPGTTIETSFALVCALFFITGFGVALALSAFKEALSSFRFWRLKKADQRSEEAEGLFAKGRGLSVHGNSRSARRVLQRAQRMAPGRTGIALELARAEIGDKKYDTAERRLKTLLEAEPKNPEVLSLHLELYRKRDNFEGQIATLIRWMEVDPKRLETLVLLRDLYAGVSNFSEAARIQDQVLTLTEGRNEREAERSRLIQYRMKQAAALPGGQAIGVLNKVLAAAEYAPAYAAMGRIQRELGQISQAEQSWLKGFQSTRQAGLLLLLEKERVSEGRAEEMLKLYKKLGRKHGAPVLLRARLLISLGRFQEALDGLQRADRSLATSAMGRWIEGEALYRLEQFQRAAGAYRESVGAAGNAPLVSFTCKNCGVPAPHWQPSCPACSSGDGLELDVGARALPAS